MIEERESPAQKINQYLNDIYNEIAKEAFELDGYWIPYHGIKQPDKENPINLFQR